jgi:hypothetical protein
LIENPMPDGFNTYFGDSNLDGEFSSADFVTVFAAGKYETGAEAGWDAGDWNGDMIFDSSDFVTAFSGGGYELGPRAAVASVPEPISLLAVTLPLVFCCRRVRRIPVC